MTAREMQQTPQALLDDVARLMGEFDDYPAGVVMRCYSRAVRSARWAGIPSTELPDEVERRTRAMLRARRGDLMPPRSGPAKRPDRGGPRVRIPAPALP